VSPAPPGAGAAEDEVSAEELALLKVGALVPPFEIHGNYKPTKYYAESSYLCTTGPAHLLALLLLHSYTSRLRVGDAPSKTLTMTSAVNVKITYSVNVNVDVTVINILCNSCSISM
jgi:hypothetical protein